MAHEYLEDAGSLRTLSQAVEIADRESILAANRQAVRESYSQQAEYLRRAAGSGEPDMPAEDDTSFTVDSPTTVVNSGVPAWAIATIAAAMALAGIGGGIGLTALLTRPDSPAPVVTQPPGPATIPGDNYRVTIE